MPNFLPFRAGRAHRALNLRRLNVSEFREVSFQENVTQRTPCVLILDASGSMGVAASGANKSRIALLNEGVHALRKEIDSDEMARVRVRLLVISVGGPNDVDVVTDWTDAVDFRPTELSAGGTTPLGQGIRLGLEMLRTERRRLAENGIGLTRPWMIVMSDGAPDVDQWREAATELRQAEANKLCTVFPIGIDGGDLQKLGELTAQRPALAMASVKFTEFFSWLSIGLSQASRSKPGDALQLPSADAWAHISV